MLPKESTLRKEFSKRDVQRMRNLITGNSGDRTQIQGGWENKKIDYKEGDIWEEDGKKWTIKNGIKQSITKLDRFKHLINLPLTCPNCSKPMRQDELNKKAYLIKNTCFDCMIKWESQLKLEGKYQEYERKIINDNKNASLEEFEQALDAWLLEKDTFVSEEGDIENWSGGDKTKMYEEIKAKIEELKKIDIY